MKDDEEKQVVIFLGITATVVIILFFIANMTGEIKLKENPVKSITQNQLSK